MKLIFIHGPAASGKLTIGKALAVRTGFALFHNHLVVDAVMAVFPFGSEPFVRLRDQFWMSTFEAAVKADRSLIFTFAPEGTVARDFPDRVRALVEASGGEIAFVQLTLDDEERERRLVDPSRAAFGKLMSVDLARQLRADFQASEAAMPAPDLLIDTGALPATEAAELIAAKLDLPLA